MTNNARETARKTVLQNEYGLKHFWTNRLESFEAEHSRHFDGHPGRDEAEIQADVDRCRERAEKLEGYRPKPLPYWMKKSAA